MTLTYRITTLGCRMNHAESRDIESLLLARGLQPAESGTAADLEVVHTCTVTTTAAAKSRHAVRRAARRAAPQTAPPVVIATGCWAGSDGTAAGRILGDPSAVIPHGSPAVEGTTDDGAGTPANADSTFIERLALRVDQWLSERGTTTPIRSNPADSSANSRERTSIIPLPVVLPARAARHTRAEIRIQDGCDAHCTFCIIPTTRPTLRSKSIDDTVREAARLVELGHREIVLSGVFMGAYGHETALRRRQSSPGSRLADLVDAVAGVSGLQRLRLSSVEPGDVDEALLDAMVANAAVVVPHLHVPLQSGSDAVLRRMNRQYGVTAYLEMIDMVEAALTRDGLPPALTTDVICGFPGETEDDFARTIEVAERVGYLHQHVFPFSPRAGTAAARWKDKFVDDRVKKGRVRTLIDREEDPEDGWSVRYRRRLVGRTVRVMIESAEPGDPTTGRGRCDHYAMIDIRGTVPLERGELVEVVIDAVDGPITSGRVASASAIPLPILEQVSPGRP